MTYLRHYGTRFRHSRRMRYRLARLAPIVLPVAVFLLLALSRR